MLSRPWGHPVVLNTGPLDWESTVLTTMPLLLNAIAAIFTSKKLCTILLHEQDLALEKLQETTHEEASLY